MKKPPRFLYKYMGSRLDRIEDILVNRRLHFANPSIFNDPFDCASGLDLRQGATKKDWIKYFIHLVQEEEPDSTLDYQRAKAKDNFRRGRHTSPDFIDGAEEGIRRVVGSAGRKQGVLCLSSDPKNVIMWAHYADKHEGVVLRFDTRHMGDQASHELRCFQVKYSLSFPQLPDYLAALREYRRGDLRAFTELWLCRKSRDWRYEKEWRFFTSQPNSLVEFEPPMLSAIIFGWKMPESTRQSVAAWAEALYPKPKFLYAEPCADRFRMDITAVKPKAQQQHRKLQPDPRRRGSG